MNKNKIPDTPLEARRRHHKGEMDDKGTTLDMIIETAIQGDVELLGFFARNFGINYVESGKHALFWIAGTNDLQAAKILIQAGSTVHNAGKKAASPPYARCLPQPARNGKTAH